MYHHTMSMLRVCHLFTFTDSISEEMTSNTSLEKVTVFFYNPNTHPRREYEIGREENKSYCDKIAVSFIDVDYNVDNWYKRMKGLEYDPERVHQCTNSISRLEGFETSD
jgi:predicted adenine nucleotide alpha hydrolase (AANH) superfamily ATPase